MASTSDSTPLYDILSTPYGGRGAFARQAIPKGTPILSCAAPYAHVVYWEFRREVCAWCFAYSFESAKSKWSLKLAENECAGGNGGVWFCSTECRGDYIREHEVVAGHGVEWRTQINMLVEKMLVQKKRVDGPPVPPGGLVYLETVLPEGITPNFLNEAWTAAQKVSDTRKGWTEELTELEVDTARFVLDGLLRKIMEEANPSAATLDRLSEESSEYRLGAGRWADYMDLQDNEYELMRRSPYMLPSYIRIYRFLKHMTTMLPQTRSSLDHISLDIIARLRHSLSSPSDTRALLGRDSGNVFGIWDMATDEGSEMLGWGAFVFASYFNHRASFFLLNPCFGLCSTDCEPNLKKKRNKRGVQFYALKDIVAGEEICISYSDGISVEERMRQLERGWFFVCGCTRCVQDLELASGQSTPL